MNKIYLSFVFMSLLFIASVNASGIIISDVTVPEITPGGEALITISIENTFDKDVEDVSISLNFRDFPLSAVGSSENTIEKIKEDEEENVVFRIRASPTAKPGDYQIPFSLTYKNGNATQTKIGAIGIRVKGTVQLSASITTATPVFDKSDRISVKIINKGFADARYVTVRLVPTDFVLRSDEIVYIGDISANDFETATFNVRYTEKKPIASITIEYRDFNNVLQTLVLQEEITIYSEDEAIKRGIVERSKTPFYIWLVVVILVLWFVWRVVRRQRRLRKSMQASSSH